MFTCPKILTITAGLALHGMAQPVIPGWDDSGIEYSQVRELGFDLSPGNLGISDILVHAILIPSSTPCPGLEIYPALGLRSTTLAFNDVPTSLPVDPSQFESFRVYPTVIGLSNLAMLTPGDSRWILGIWTQAQLASDFRDLGYEDFNFDLAGGFGFRFTDRFSFGIGCGATDINRRFPEFLPGVGLDWAINDRFRIQGCGPIWRATFIPGKVCQISIRGESTGEIWNIADEEGKSRFIDLDSYRVGAFVSLHVANEVRFEVGTGITFGNNISLTQPDGSTIIQQGLDNGWFGQIGFSMQCW